MKKLFAILAVAGFMAACNSGENTENADTTTVTTDTTTVVTPDTATVVTDTTTTVSTDTTTKK
ncbi:MAG TPA: hypothetical protein VF145_08045 [Chitinophagaceae bacterium]